MIGSSLLRSGPRNNRCVASWVNCAHPTAVGWNSDDYQALVYGRVRQLGHEIFFHTSCLGDNRGHRHLDNVTSQWSAGAQERRGVLADRCSPVEGKGGQAPRFAISPMGRKSIQKFLYQERAIVTQVVDTGQIVSFDAKLDQREKIWQREQMNPRWLAPNGEEPLVHQPARRLRQFYASAVNDAGAQHQRLHDFVLAGAKQIFLGFEPGASVDRLGVDIQLAPSRRVGSGAFLDVRKTHQNELSHGRRERGVDDVLDKDGIGPMEKTFGTRLKKHSGEIDDAVDIFTD
jgi:hypothetical protein